MEKKQRVLEFRDRLDKTLASPNLVNEESIKSLVRNQLLRSSCSRIEGDIEDLVQRRTMEMSNLLKMLRCTSGNDNEELKTHGTLHNDWKLKQDSGQVRVMYREGSQGTPFHTLLAEGYIDGPIDVCLCVSWESTLYKKWWPQFSIPPFKIITSTCLKKVRIGEEISIVRMKVPWPLAAREAVVEFFLLEYIEDDLVIVLMNTVSDTELCDIQTHGFYGDVIPEAKDMVRIELVGGFALQKVNSNKSYFRTIMNIDIKIDFVPPTLINFISRQLIGSGFKLYQKAVTSVANGDEEFSKALEGPMYARLRESLKASNKDKDSKLFSSEVSVAILSEEQAGKTSNDDDFKAVEVGPAYVSGPEDLKSCNKDKNSRVFDNGNSIHILAEENTAKIANEDFRKSAEEGEIQNGECIESCNKCKDPKTFDNEHNVETLMGHTQVIDRRLVSKIEEEEIESSTFLEENQQINHSSIHPTDKQCHASKGGAFISPEVQWALGVLDKAISLINRQGYTEKRTDSLSTNQELQNLEKVARTSSTFSLDSNGRDALKMQNMDKSSDEAGSGFVFNDFRLASVDPPSTKADDNQKSAADLRQNSPISGEIQDGSSLGGMINSTVIIETGSNSNMLNGGYKEADVKVNGTHESSVSGGEKFRQKKKKQRVCCL
ncbi:polyketide cyclase/dehydrase/lipid transport superfamily protein [Tasmannia lanceolata]|uniref:polyketide cyclase/dehydrase/lipid transport superfamily protein n=1 Tax=Tasmannia lanceolata TaxID=3420 RepID=UPI004063460C